METPQFIQKNKNGLSWLLAVFSLSAVALMAWDMYKDWSVPQKEYAYYTAFPDHSDHELASTRALKLPYGSRYYWVVDVETKTILDIEKHDLRWAQEMRSKGLLDE